MANLAPTLAQSTPVATNPVVQDLIPVVDSPLSTPSTDVFDINSNPAVRSLIETARSEEKTKLYATIESLKEEIKGLKSKLSEKMSPDEKMVQMIEDLQRQAAEATTRFNALVNEVTVERQNYTTALNNARLQSYLDRRLREEKDKGTKLVLEMVTGSTEQEIEQSIVASAAEEARRRAMYLQEFQQQYGSNGTVIPVSVTAVPVAAPAVQPSAFPAPLNAAPIPNMDAGSEAFVAKVAELTTPESVRSGDYAKNRSELMALIRQGKVPPAGVPFANMPRAYVPQTNHGQVTQPTGHPTGPVMNPNMHTNVAQPLPIATTQPVSATGVQPVMLPPAAINPAIADMRAQAIQHATVALANPAHAGRAEVKSGRPPTHPEYRGVAMTNPVFDGHNPMERTT